MTMTAAPLSPSDTPIRRTRRWIDEWRPEDPAFWEGGKGVARRNLIWSLFAEHLQSPW